MPFATRKSPLSRSEIAISALALPVVLPDDIDALKALLHAQHAAVKKIVASAEAAVDTARREAQEYIQRMIEQMVLARHRQFGVSSEQLSEQSRLFDEAEVTAFATLEAQDIAPIPDATTSTDGSNGDDKKSKQKGRGKRSPLPSDLKRVDVVHDMPLAERTCPCGTPMVEIGEDVSEQLDIVPMQVRVLRHIRKRYARPGNLHAPVTASLPPLPLPKSNASADFLAMLLAVKFVDGLPLAGFECVLGRHGFPVEDVEALLPWNVKLAQRASHTAPVSDLASEVV